MFLAVSFCLLAAELFGCGHGTLTAAKPPPRTDVETRAFPIKRQREMPRLIAPPPAYGNKIVMARDERTPPVN